MEGQSLAVMGPNLHGSPTTFRVHADGCADIAREYRKYHSVDHGFRETFVSKGEVIDTVYDFIGGDNSEDGDPTFPQHRGEYWMEFHFAPCVTLPDHTEDTTQEVNGCLMG